MRHVMANGRIPRKIPRQQPSGDPMHPQVDQQEPVSPQRARDLILQQRAWDGMRVSGHLNLGGATHLTHLPANLTCESLDISDCVNLTTLPPGLHVTYWIELSGSGITYLPPGHGFVLRWRGVQVNDQIAFSSRSITGQEILNVENVELRRILIERMGYETFLQQVGGVIRHQDQDRGGERQLVCIPFDDDEPLMILKVTCPSTGHHHVLRVPPYMRHCQQAAAWIAGFDNPDDYDPIVEA